MNVVDAVEELLQVHIHHHFMARLHVLLCLEHRPVRASPRPEAVAVLAQSRVDDRLQHLQQRLLDQSVHHGRYAQFALSASRFGYAHAAHRTGPVAAVEQLRPDVRPGGLQIHRRVLHRASIDAGAALVGFDAPPRRSHVLSGQRLPEQLASPAVRLCAPRRLGFIVPGLCSGFTLAPCRTPGSPRHLMHCLVEPGAS
jgi:hypothetical protein